MHNSLAIYLFASSIAHIDFLEVQNKSISSDMRLRAFVLLVAKTDTLYADPHYSAQRREESNSTKLSDKANDNVFSSHS